MVDARGEVDLGRFEGVVGREVDRKEENAAGVWRVTRTHDRGLPVELSDGQIKSFSTIDRRRRRGAILCPTSNDT